MKEKLFLVTGAGGFVGSQYIKHLNSLGIDNIIAFDCNLSNAKVQNIKNLKISFFENNKYKIFNYIKNSKTQYVDFDVVLIHMGANSSTTCQDKNIIEENTNFTLDLVDKCEKYDIPMIYASSASVYGKKRDKTYDPLCLYAYSKYLVDNILEKDEKFVNTTAALVGLRFFNCYDEKTEALTQDGFKYIKNITKKDWVATINQKGEIEYQQPTELLKFIHKGEMIHFNGNRTNILCTPDQNLYLSRNGHKYELLSAEKASNNKNYALKLKQNAIWPKDFVATKEVIPEAKHKDGRLSKNNQQKKVDINLWLKFLGWFLSEGSIFSGTLKKNTNRKYDSTYYRVNISQSKNQDYIKEILQICKEMGFNPQIVYKKRNGIKTVDGVTIHSKQLYNHLLKFKHQKYIPREYLNLSSDSLQNLFSTLMKGDDHKNKNRYTTIYKEFADQFQELLLKIGKVGRIRQEVQKNNKIIYRIDIAKNAFPQIGNNEKKKVNCSRVPWNDYVYDITVPNHTFLMRREGFVCWTGNCYGPGEQHKGEQASVVCNWHAQKERQIKVFEGINLRDFIHIEDVCKIIHFFVENSYKIKLSGIYDIGTGIARDFMDIAAIFEKRYGSTVTRVPMPELIDKQYQDFTQADCLKLRKAGYSSNFLSLEEGVEKYLEFLDGK